jgi:transcriptional regulator with XRE-family HTH domain
MARLILDQVLKRKKISKYRFAKLLDMEYDNVFRFFRKGYDPKLSVLTRWAQVLGCKVRDLIKE